MSEFDSGRRSRDIQPIRRGPVGQPIDSMIARLEDRSPADRTSVEPRRQSPVSTTIGIWGDGNRIELPDHQIADCRVFGQDNVVSCASAIQEPQSPEVVYDAFVVEEPSRTEIRDSSRPVLPKGTTSRGLDRVETPEQRLPQQKGSFLSNAARRLLQR